VIYLYTDGSGSAKDKTGGWGHVLLYNDKRRLGCGGGPNYTSNAMELMAMLKGMQAIRINTRPVVILSDSKYALACLFQYSPGWRRRGWLTAAGLAVKNRHIIEPALDELTRLRAEGAPVHGRWVKGHVGVAYNEVADRLAGMGRARFAAAHGAIEHEEIMSELAWAEGWLP
jgi:ribonuclease HI